MTEETTVAQRLLDLERSVESLMEQMIKHGIAPSSDMQKILHDDGQMERRRNKTVETLLGAMFRDDVKIIRVLGKLRSGKTIALRKMALVASVEYPVAFVSTEKHFEEPRIKGLQSMLPNEFLRSARTFKYAFIDDLDTLPPGMAKDVIAHAMKRISIWETGKLIYSAEEEAGETFLSAFGTSQSAWQAVMG